MSSSASINRSTSAPGRRAEEICLSLGPSSKVSYNTYCLYIVKPCINGLLCSRDDDVYEEVTLDGLEHKVAFPHMLNVMSTCLIILTACIKL